MSLQQPQGLERFEVVGRGSCLQPDGSIAVQAGWDVPSTLEGAVLLKLRSKLKHVRIQAEFRGYMETRWEGLGKEATKPESPDYKVTRYGRVFQQMVEVVYSGKEAIVPDMVGGSNVFPFKFKLPKASLPSSFESYAGSIQYYLKCSMLYQEGMNLLKSNFELEVPVIITMPEAAKLKLLSAPSHLRHQGDPSNEKVDFIVELQRRILHIGDTLEVDVIINSTPGDTRIRSINASLRSLVSYIHVGSNVGSQSKIPRPLSEMSQSFPLVKVGNGGVEPIARRVFLLVDPELACPSFESPFIQSKTIFRLEVIIDDSETPNISYEIPVVVIPPLGEMKPIGFGSPSATVPPVFGVPTIPTLTGVPVSPSISGISPSTSGMDPPARKRSLAHSDTASSIFDSPPSLTTRSMSYALTQGYYSPIVSPRMSASGNGYQEATTSSSAGGNQYRPRMPRSSSMVRGQHVQDGGRGELARHNTTSGLSEGHLSYGSTELYGMHRSRSFSNNPGALHGNSAPQEKSSSSQIMELDRLNSEQAKLSQLLAELQAMEMAGKGITLPDGQIPFDFPGKPSTVASESLRSRNSSMAPREDWSVQMVADWVKQIGADEGIVQNFIEQQVDGVVLMTLNGEDLQHELGVALAGMRHKILRAIEGSRV